MPDQAVRCEGLVNRAASASSNEKTPVSVPRCQLFQQLAVDADVTARFVFCLSLVIMQAINQRFFKDKKSNHHINSIWISEHRASIVTVNEHVSTKINDIPVVPQKNVFESDFLFNFVLFAQINPQ